MTIDGGVVIAAAITALPATLAAIAALKSSRRGKEIQRQTETCNGHTLGETVDLIHDSVIRLRSDFRSHLLDHGAHGGRTDG